MAHLQTADVTLSQAATFTLMAHLQTADVTLSQAYMAHRRIGMITSQKKVGQGDMQGAHLNHTGMWHRQEFLLVDKQLVGLTRDVPR